jgi:hypothetical protein
MANFTAGLDKAPRDGRELLLVVPTGEKEMPLTREVGWYDGELRRWEGDWRYYEGEGGYARAEPIAWAELPSIDEALFHSLKAQKAPKRALLAPATAPATPIDGAKVSKQLAKHEAVKADRQAAEKAARKPSKPTAKPSGEPVDRRPAKGKHGFDMTTGRPIIAANGNRNPKTM